MNEFRELIPEFLSEAREHLLNIESETNVMLDNLAKNNSPDKEILKGLFRAMHSIRGGSGFVGFSNIEELTYKLESLLNLLRNDDLIFSQKIANVFISSVEKLRELVELSEKGDDSDIASYLKGLDGLMADNLNKRTEESLKKIVGTKDLTNGFDFNISKYSIERKQARENIYFIRLDAVTQVQQAGRSIIDFVSELVSFGEILDTSIDLSSVSENSLKIGFLYLSSMRERVLRFTFSYLQEDSIRVIDPDEVIKLFYKKNDARELVPGVRKKLSTIFSDKSDDIVVSDEKALSIVEQESNWDNISEFVTFFIGKEQYAVPIFIVHDIKEMLPCSKLPNQPDHICGVANLRGNVIPIIDMRKKLNVENVNYGQYTVMLILNVKGQVKGCVVDAINDVVKLEQQNKQTTPMLSRGINTEYVRFIGKDPKTASFLIVLDVEKILCDD